MSQPVRRDELRKGLRLCRSNGGCIVSRPSRTFVLRQEVWKRKLSPLNPHAFGRRCLVIAKKLSPTALSDVARRASFIFRGRVRSLGKHNLDGVQNEERMALVRVVEVIVAPPTVGDLTGRTITVYLESTRDLRANAEATFFATSWHYGRNIGVIEIARTATPVAELRPRVVDERLEAFNANLETRIRRASLIVSGHVLTTTRTDD